MFGRLEAEAFASVRLPDNEALVVSAGGQSKQMRWTVEPRGGGQYAASLSQLDEGTLITVALERGDGNDAANLQVTMPLEVDITEPLEGQTVTAGDNLLVNWAPSGTAEQMQVILRTVECTRPGAGSSITYTEVGDAGTATVLVDPDILPPLATGEQCLVDVQVQRVAYGTVDPAFADGGSILARQVDVVQIVVLQP